jgi:hypothetical protein
MSAEQTFRAKAPGIVLKLLADFPFAPEDGFAIIGNAGHESLGFTAMQEITPTVKAARAAGAGSNGPVRAVAHSRPTASATIDPASDKANYAWLFLELRPTSGRRLTRSAPLPIGMPRSWRLKQPTSGQG